MLDAAKQERGPVPAETTRITDNPAMRATPAERFFGIAEMRQQLYKHLDKPSLAMSAVLCQRVLEEVVPRLYAEIKYEHKDTFVHSPDRSQLYRNAVRTLILNWADKTTATEVRDATAALDLTALGQPTGLDASSKRQLAIISLARDLFPAVINILQPASDHEQSIRLDPTTELRGHITEVAEYYYADNGDDEEELASCGTLLSGFTRAASAIDMHLSNPSPACFDMLKARPPGARVRDIHIAGSRTTPRYMRSLFTLLRSLGDDLGYIRVISVDNSTEHDIMHLAEWSFPNLRDLILGRYGNNDGAPASLCLAQLPDILQVLSTSPELEHLALYLTASPGFGECAREWSPPTSRPMRLESVWLFFDERSRVNKGRWYNVLYHLAGWVVENGDIRFIMHGQNLSRRYPLMHVYEDAAEAFKRLHRRLDKPFSICDRDMYDLGVTSSDDIDQLLIDPNGEPYTVLQSLIRHVWRHGDLDRIEEGRRVGELMQVIQNKEAQPEQAEDSYNQLRELTFRWGFPERPDTADATPMPRKVTYLLGSEYRAVRGMQKLMDYLGRIEWGRKAE